MTKPETTNESKIKINGISHFAINVSNMDRALEFYNGVLGFQILFQTETRGGLRHVEVEAGNVAIALFETPDIDLPTAQKIMTDDGYLHYAFSVSKKRYDEVMQELKDKNVRFDGEPRNRHNDAVSVYVYDPDGHIIEFRFETEE